MSNSPKFNLLTAYPYMDPSMWGLLKEHGDDVRFLLDSGAFTAWRSGNPIKLDDYCRFLDAMPMQPWRYFMLDVIYDPRATMDNYQSMVMRGYKPIPVFTPGQALEDIDRYYETSDLVACGGLANKYEAKSQRWLKNVMLRANGRPIHLLGYTSPNWVKYHKPYSCDSSTWVNGTRYGAIHLYMGGGTFKIITKKTAAKPLKPEYLERIRALGIDPYLLQRRESWAGSPGQNVAHQINTRSWIIAMVEYERRLDVKLFLATAKTYASMLLKEWASMRHQGIF